MIGRFRISILRSSFLFSLQTWGMIVYATIQDTGFLWWYSLVPIGILAWMIFDMAVVWKQELEISLKDNQEWKNLRKDIAELKKEVQSCRKR